MAKRYLDTGFFKSPYVRSLKGSLKSLYLFIVCDCDNSGIWVKDLQIASSYIDFPVTEKDFEIFIKSGKAADLKNGKFFFPDFIEHQYPNGLNPHNPAHKKAISELKRYNLINENLEVLKRVSGVPTKGTMGKGKEEGKEDKGGVGEKSKPIILPFASEEFKSAWESLLQEKHWKKKSDAALLASLKKLGKVPESHALKMIENTISGEWKGIFALKPEELRGIEIQSKLDPALSINEKLKQEIREKHERANGAGE